MANNPTLLAMPLAENGQKNTIPVTQAAAGDGLFSQSTGFPPETALPLGAGGVAPKREDFNGAFNVLSDIAFYAQKGWVFKWDAGQAYFKGCEVIDPADGLKYRCIQDVDAGGDAPSADEAVHWWPVIEGESIGSVKMCLATTIPDGWLSLENGQLVLRSAFPELWAWVQGNAPLITEAQWQTKAAAQKSVGYYSDGDGSTTFRLPRLVGFMEGVTAANVGQFTAAGVPNINGTITWVSSVHTPATTGAFGNASASTTGFAAGNTPQYVNTMEFDASRSSAIYGASNTVQPESVGMVWCVRAFGAATNQGTVDITALAQMLNLKLSIADAPAVCTPFGFPSDTYVNLGTPAAMQKVTAPANGYITLSCNSSSSASAYVEMVCHALWMRVQQGAANSVTAIIMPVSKDDVVTINYVGCTLMSCLFSYAKGEV